MKHPPHADILGSLPGENKGQAGAGGRCFALERPGALSFAQPLRRFRRGLGDHGHAVHKRLAPNAKGVRNIQQVEVGVMRQVLSQPVPRGGGLGRTAGRYPQHAVVVGSGGGCSQWGFFDHHMGIGAADTERADASSARAVATRPGRQAGVHLEGRVRQIHLRVGLLEMQRRWDLFVLERQAGLDQTSGTCGRDQVPHIRFDRSDQAVAHLIGAAPESPGQCRHLDRVAQRGGRAVGFDVADGVGAHPGIGLRRQDDGGLSVDAGRGEAGFGRAVVVGGRAFDDGVNVVSVCEGVAQSLEQHHSGAIAEHGAFAGGIECACAPIR